MDLFFLAFRNLGFCRLSPLLIFIVLMSYLGLCQPSPGGAVVCMCISREILQEGSIRKMSRDPDLEAPMLTSLPSTQMSVLGDFCQLCRLSKQSLHIGFAVNRLYDIGRHKEDQLGLYNQTCPLSGIWLAWRLGWLGRCIRVLPPAWDTKAYPTYLTPYIGPAVLGLSHVTG